MACLSGPPVVHGRRLFELLEEQQEPFQLDVYLLERGYSEDRLLASQPTSIVCWLAGDACKRLQRLTSLRFKAWREGLLSNILSWVDKAPNSARRGVFCLSDLRNKADGVEAEVFASSVGRIAGEVNGKFHRRHIELESREISPVSVLELRSCEESPVHHVYCKPLYFFLSCVPVCDAGQHVVGSFLASDKEDKISTLGFDLPTKVIDLFNELLELAYTPEFYQLIGSTKQIDQSDKLFLECEREAEEKILEFHECLKPEITRKIVPENIPPLERQKDLNTIRQLTVSDISSSRSEWSQFQPEVREIGIEIDAILFEGIKEETILEMLGSHCTFQRSLTSL